MKKYPFYLESIQNSFARNLMREGLAWGYIPSEPVSNIGADYMLFSFRDDERKTKSTVVFNEFGNPSDHTVAPCGPDLPNLIRRVARSVIVDLLGLGMNYNQ